MVHQYSRSPNNLWRYRIVVHIPRTGPEGIFVELQPRLRDATKYHGTQTAIATRSASSHRADGNR